VGEPLKRNVRHLPMTTGHFNSRIRFMVRSSPLLFVLATVWAVFAWRHTRLSFAYLSACIVIGLICGALMIVDYLKNSSPFVGALWWTIVISAPMLLRGFVFTDLEVQGTMAWSYQDMSVVLATMLALLSICRDRISRRIAKCDAEQALAADSP
jgi:hypothetical protein